MRGFNLQIKTKTMHTFRDFNLFTSQRLLWFEAPKGPKEAIPKNVRENLEGSDVFKGIKAGDELTKFVEAMAADAENEPDFDEQEEIMTPKLGDAERNENRLQRIDQVENELQQEVLDKIAQQGDREYSILLDGEWVLGTVHNRQKKQLSIWENQGKPQKTYMIEEEGKEPRYATAKQLEKEYRKASKEQDKVTFKKGEKQRRKDEAELWALGTRHEFTRPFKNMGRLKNENRPTEQKAKKEAQDTKKDEKRQEQYRARIQEANNELHLEQLQIEEENARQKSLSQGGVLPAKEEVNGYMGQIMEWQNEEGEIVQGVIDSKGNRIEGNYDKSGQFNLAPGQQVYTLEDILAIKHNIRNVPEQDLAKVYLEKEHPILTRNKMTQQEANELLTYPNTADVENALAKYTANPEGKQMSTEEAQEALSYASNFLQEEYGTQPSSPRVVIKQFFSLKYGIENVNLEAALYVLINVITKEPTSKNLEGALGRIRAENNLAKRVEQERVANIPIKDYFPSATEDTRRMYQNFFKQNKENIGPLNEQEQLIAVRVLDQFDRSSFKGKNKKVVKKQLEFSLAQYRNNEKVSFISPERILNNEAGELFNQERYDEAASAYEKLIDIDPGNPDHYVDYGFTLDALEQYAQAAQAYKEASKINPDNYEYWFLQGEALLELKQNQEAITSLEKAVNLMLNNKDVENYDLAYGYSILGQAYMTNNEPQKAVDAFNKALKADPDDDTNRELLEEAKKAL